VSNSRLEVSVTFDLARGYVASALELRLPVTALRSSGSLPSAAARRCADHA
jgi:hypothetical protein